MFSGLIIKESLADEKILDYVRILHVEIWSTDRDPKYWTAITFESDEAEFPEILSKTLCDKSKSGMVWYVDMTCGAMKYIVLKNNVLKYRIGDGTEKEAVMKKCRVLGVDESQLDWAD